MTDPSLSRQRVKQRLIDGNEFPNLPPNWDVERLRFLFRESKERNGKSPVGVMLSVSEYKGVVPRNYEDEEQKRNDEELENYRVVRVGQLAVNSMWLNHLGLGVSDHIGHVSPAYSVYDISERLDRRFVHHLMRSNYYLKIYLRYLYGIRPNSFQIKASDWDSIPIIVPDLPTQRAIADFLDRETARIDLLIEKKQRLMELLIEKTRSAINRATTVGFRDCKTQLSGKKWLGEVASHWRITPIKWFARVQSGYAFKAERFRDFGTPLVRMNNLKRGVLDLNDAVAISGEDVNESVMLRAGDILIGMSGSIGETGSLGNFAFVKDRDLPCLLNQRVGRFHLIGKDLLPEYLALVIQSAAFLDPIFLAATSTAQYNVSPSQIGSILFTLPPVAEQREIIDELSKNLSGLNAIKERSMISIDRLREYRSALITAAVTGQIDVTKWVKAGTADRKLDAVQATTNA